MAATDAMAEREPAPPPAVPPVPAGGSFVLIPTGFARFLGVSVSLLLLLSVLGYPVVGAGASLYLVESRDFAVGFRALVLLLSVGLIGIALARVPTGVLRFLPLPMAVLVVLYTIRLIADAMSGQFPELSEVSLYFFGTCVIPALALAVLAPFHTPQRDGPMFLVAGMLLCAFILVTSQAELGATVDAATIGEGRLNLTRLNPISIGHVGVTTLVAVLAIYFEPGHARWLKLLLIPAAAVALVAVFAAGSRGPLVSLVGVIGALLVFQRRWRLLVFIVIAAAIWAIQTTNLENTLLDRILSVGSDQSSTIRLDLQALAFEQFLGKPILGSAYVELVTGFNPHNIILEAAMALGIVGLGLALWICFRAGVLAIRRMYDNQLMLPLLMIQYLLAVQFSGSLSASNEFWVCAALLLTSARRRARPGPVPAEIPAPAAAR